VNWHFAIRERVSVRFLIPIETRIHHASISPSKEAKMRAFIMACIAVVAIALGAAAILFHFQEPAAVAFSTSAVRL
jgi:hypothetical protein